jgi:hypothetical protein
MLIVDYIAVSLLLYGGYKSLQTGDAAGLLCGAWGFEFCLNYRAFFWRVDRTISGTSEGSAAIETTAYVLGCLLVVSLAMFLITIYLATPKANNV